MPLAEVLLGLKALILEGPEAADRAALLARRAPGLAPDERATLLALPPERVQVYADLVRAGQATMLDFVAPSTVEVAERFAGTTKADLSRVTLVETPRRSSRLRELAQRVVDHLRGAGAGLVAACPPLLDLARLDQASTEAFYAPDEDGALSPAEFGASVERATVEEALALEGKPSAATRIVAFDHDVDGWRRDRFERGEWATPPPRLGTPIERVVTRDPATLQPAWHEVDARLLGLLRPATEGFALRPGTEGFAWQPLERWAEAWVAATGADPDDALAPARFFEQLASWVHHGLFVCRRAPAVSAEP